MVNLFNSAGMHCFLSYIHGIQQGLHACREAFLLFYRPQLSLCLQPVWWLIKKKKVEKKKAFYINFKQTLCLQKAILLLTFN